MEQHTRHQGERACHQPKRRHPADRQNGNHHHQQKWDTKKDERTEERQAQDINDAPHNSALMGKRKEKGRFVTRPWR